MASSIRLTTSGTPETPPSGYARLFVEEFDGKIYLKMIRPDGSIEVFGTLNSPLDINQGGTGVTSLPEVGQFLIGTSTGYRTGDITPGNGINIVKSDTEFEISATLSNLDLVMPDELDVDKSTVDSQTTITVSKKPQLKNSIYASPVDEDGIPSFRFIQLEDLPDIPISKIIDLIETIRAESLLIPVDSNDIDHAYDNVAKTLTSTLKPTNVTPGQYGAVTKTLQLNVKADGRLDELSEADIAIPSTQITDFNEAVQNQVGALIIDSVSVNAEYNDYENTLKLHVNEETLITTNISENENVRAPTSQAIKQYVDDLLTAERNARIIEDTDLQNSITALETQVGENLQQALQDINTSISDEIAARAAADDLINQRLDTFFQNAPEVLDTIVEISNRFNEVELAIVQGASVQAQALEDEVERIDGELTLLSQGLQDEEEARISDITTIASQIVDESDARIQNDQITLNSAKAYTDLSISAIVDSAPELLNTLKELSDALGGDADFATTISNQFTQVTTDITEETSARIAADNALDERLDVVQGTGQGSIVKAETDAKLYADGIVLIEKNRAELAESNLDDKITDVASDLTIEITNRTNADTQLQNNIDSERNARIGADALLDERLDIIEGLDTVEGSIKKALKDAKAYTDQLVDIEEGDRIAADNNLQGQINSEITTRQNADTLLDGKITTETTARQTAINTINGRLDVLQGDNNTVGSVAKAESDAKSYADTKISNLVNSAPEVLNTLKELADALGNDANFATTISGQIGSLNTAINNEITNRQTADALLIPLSQKGANSGVATLDSEGKIPAAQLRISEIVVNSTAGTETDKAPSVNAIKLYVDGAVASEAGIRQTQDNFLSQRLNIIEGSGQGSIAKAEIDAKAYADSKINELVNGAPELLNTLNELAAAIGNDQNFITTINTSISTIETSLLQEVDNRQTSDTQINSLITSLQSNLSTEETNRINADNSLQNSINNIQSQLSLISEDRINELVTDLANETVERQAADDQINQRLNTFFANSSQDLNTLAEIEQRFELFETGSASTAGQLESFRTEVNTKINVDLANIQALIGIEADARVAEINRISNSISAKREQFELTPSMITGPIELVHVQSISKIMPNSVVAFIDRLGIFEGLDFNLQNTEDNKVILNFTPEILTILDGTEVLRMTYLKKE